MKPPVRVGAWPLLYFCHFEVSLLGHRGKCSMRNAGDFRVPIGSGIATNIRRPHPTWVKRTSAITQKGVNPIVLCGPDTHITGNRANLSKEPRQRRRRAEVSVSPVGGHGVCWQALFQISTLVAPGVLSARLFCISVRREPSAFNSDLRTTLIILSIENSA